MTGFQDERSNMRRIITIAALAIVAVSTMATAASADTILGGLISQVTSDH